MWKKNGGGMEIIIVRKIETVNCVLTSFTVFEQYSKYFNYFHLDSVHCKPLSNNLASSCLDSMSFSLVKSL